MSCSLAELTGYLAPAGFLAELQPLWKLSAPTPPDLFDNLDGSWTE